MKLPFGYQLTRPKIEPPQKYRQPARAQTRESANSPFAAAFSTYNPLEHNIGLFRTIREAVPFIDVGIQKSVRLIGDFEFVTDDDKLREKLDDFKDHVQVNWFDNGFMSFMAELSDSAFCTGMGFGELVPLKSMTDVHRLKTCRSEDFRFIRNNKDELVLATYDKNKIQPIPIENQELVYYLAFEKRDGHPQGYSLLYSLPFVSQVFIRMEKSWDNFTFRVGDPTFVTYVIGGPDQPSEEAVDAAADISGQIGNAMKDRKKGLTGDIYGALPPGGELHIDMLGKDAKMMEMEIPITTILQQIIAKTGFSPQMLGASMKYGNYSVTEDQNDFIVSNVKWQRKKLEPIIRRVFDTYLTLTGDAGAEWDMEWNDVNLKDEKSMARARKLDAEAAEKEINNLITLVGMGWADQEEVEDQLREAGLIKNVSKDWWSAKLKQVFTMRAAKGIVDVIK